MAFVIAIAIVIILIIIYCYCTWNTSLNEDYLYGCWLADDDEFCDESDMKSMMLFIGDYDSGERLCHLVIMDDICNQGFSIKYRPGWSGPTVGKYRIYTKATFDEFPIWPEDIVIDIDIRRGTMVIHSDGTVFARLNKQHEITNSCRRLDNEFVG